MAAGPHPLSLPLGEALASELPHLATFSFMLSIMQFSFVLSLMQVLTVAYPGITPPATCVAYMVSRWLRQSLAGWSGWAKCKSAAVSCSDRHANFAF